MEENNRNQLKQLNKNIETENAKRVKNSVVQFDLANFIRNSVTDNIQDSDPYAYKYKILENR